MVMTVAEAIEVVTTGRRRDAEALIRAQLKFLARQAAPADSGGRRPVCRISGIGIEVTFTVVTDVVLFRVDHSGDGRLLMDGRLLPDWMVWTWRRRRTWEAGLFSPGADLHEGGRPGRRRSGR